MDVIEQAQAEWEPTIMLVLIKDGTVQICEYYRTLNAVYIQDSYHILPMDDCIASFREVTNFLA